MKWLWETFIHEPIYNGLIFLVGILPGAPLWLAVTLLTIVVKIILLPLTQISLKNQIMQRKLQPEINRLRKKYKDDKQTQSLKILSLYKENKTSMFSGCLLVIVQLPIILALYNVFRQNIDLNSDLIYSFVQAPETINTMFLGIIDLTQKSLLLAIIAGIAQYFQIKYTLGRHKQNEPEEPKTEETKKQPEMQEEMTRILQKNMQYMMPIMIVIFAAMFPSAVALYWIIVNIINILQELYLQKNLEDSPIVTID